MLMNLQMENSVLMSITASTEHLKIMMNTQSSFVSQGKLKIKDMELRKGNNYVCKSTERKKIY